MNKLSTPPPKVAENIFKEVGYDSRLVGYRLKSRSGPAAVTLYSLVEAFGLLFEAHPRLDFAELSDWVNKEYHDAELAERIVDISQKEISITEKNSQIGEILFARIVQCMEILNKSSNSKAEKGDINGRKN